MMVVCSKTMTILKVIKLVDDKILFEDELIEDDYFRNLAKHRDLFKMFYYKKESKLFIKFQVPYCNFFLVFDIINQKFYFKKNGLQYEPNIGYECDKTIAMRGDKFYGIFSMVDGNPIFRVWEEIRTFDYENDTFVDTGVKWKTDERKVPECQWLITSKLFVQNVKLN